MVSYNNQQVVGVGNKHYLCSNSFKRSTIGVEPRATEPMVAALAQNGYSRLIQMINVQSKLSWWKKTLFQLTNFRCDNVYFSDQLFVPYGNLPQGLSIGNLPAELEHCQ